MKSADHHQDEYAEQIKALMGFKSDLGRFCPYLFLYRPTD